MSDASGTSPVTQEYVAQRFPEIVDRIRRENRVRSKTAAWWLYEAIRFLDACAESEEPLAPSKKVDKAWHAFILHTRAYADWCEWRYERYLHHDPAEKADKAAYVRTYYLLVDLHGRLDPKIWPPPNAGVPGGVGGACGGGGCGGGGA